MPPVREKERRLGEDRELTTIVPQSLTGKIPVNAHHGRPQLTQTPPPPCPHVLISYPAPYILLVTINREKQMNSLPVSASWEMDALWKWFDEEDSLRVAIITGSGTKAFCAGMDLKEQATLLSSPTTPSIPTYPPTGFAGLTLRHGKKPIIAAINGHAYGGGFEIALNSDLVLASPNATFAFPDVKRGTAALMGGLPRLCRIVGLQRAMSVALLGEVVSAGVMREWGIVGWVVDGERLVREAVRVAGRVAEGSPDSVVVSRMGVRRAWERGVEEATREVLGEVGGRLMEGENVREGVRAFGERRGPRWVPSKI